MSFGSSMLLRRLTASTMTHPAFRILNLPLFHKDRTNSFFAGDSTLFDSDHSADAQEPEANLPRRGVPCRRAGAEQFSDSVGSTSYHYSFVSVGQHMMSVSIG